MPETKNLTLEEIEIVFSKLTGQLVRENIANTVKMTKDIFRFRFREAFSDGGTRWGELDENNKV